MLQLQVWPEQEAFVHEILSSRRGGLVEVALFIRFLFEQCEMSSELCFQIWHGSAASPVVLFHPSGEGEDEASGSSTTPAYSLLLTVLPKSKVAAWLPLVKVDAGQNAAEDPAVWQQHLQAMDDKLVAQSAAAQEPVAVATPQQQRQAGKASMKRKLRSWHPRQQQAQPAESSASVTGKRGPSPDMGPSNGKAPRHM